MIDTCQANTMYSKLYSPNIIATGSSELDQSSYSHHADNDVGVAVIDRYTYYNLEFLEAHVRDLGSKQTLGTLFDSYDYSKIHSNPGMRYDLFPGGEEAARARKITDFFGNVQSVEVGRRSKGPFGGGGNATEGEDEDEMLVRLSRRIAELRRLEGAEEDGERESLDKARAGGAEFGKEGKMESESRSSSSSSSTLGEATQTHGPTGLSSDDWWAKKAVGAAVLMGCAALWGATALVEGKA
jgi:hypothetical protein